MESLHLHFCCPCLQALASLRQKIKKYIKEADFEASVEEFRKVRGRGRGPGTRLCKRQRPGCTNLVL